MNLLRQDGNRLHYALDRNEAEVLRVLLAKFPYSRSYPGRVSADRHCAADLNREKLLNQSLETHRAELKRLAGKILHEGIGQNADGWTLSIDAGTKECLLQILNDIRVGMWRDLGEPEELMEAPQGSLQKLQLWNIMHLASHFTAGLINEEI